MAWFSTARGLLYPFFSPDNLYDCVVVYVMEYNSQVPIFNYDRVGICVTGDKALVNIDVSYGLFRVVLLVSF